MSFFQWLRHFVGLTINVNGPAQFIFNGVKPSKATREPALLADPRSRAQRRAPLQIIFPPSKRDLLLQAPTDPRIRAGWAQTMKDISQPRKHI
jgi:hypothetical protein